MDLEAVLRGSEFICAASCFGANLAVGYLFSRTTHDYREAVRTLRDELGMERQPEEAFKIRLEGIYKELSPDLACSIGAGSAGSIIESMLNLSAYHPLGIFPKWISGMAGAYMGFKLGSWLGTRKSKRSTCLTEKEKKRIADYRQKLQDSLINADICAYDGHVKEFAEFWDSLALRRAVPSAVLDYVFTDFLRYLRQEQICREIQNAGLIKNIHAKEQTISTLFGKADSATAYLFVLNLGKCLAYGQVEKFSMVLNDEELCSSAPLVSIAKRIVPKIDSTGAFEWDTTAKDLARIIIEQTDLKMPYVISCGDGGIPLQCKLTHGAALYAIEYRKNKENK